MPDEIDHELCLFGVFRNEPRIVRAACDIRFFNATTKVTQDGNARFRIHSSRNVSGAVHCDATTSTAPFSVAAHTPTTISIPQGCAATTSDHILYAGHDIRNRTWARSFHLTLGVIARNSDPSLDTLHKAGILSEELMGIGDGGRWSAATKKWREEQDLGLHDRHAGILGAGATAAADKDAQL